MIRIWIFSIAAIILIIGALIYFTFNIQAPDQTADTEPTESMTPAEPDSNAADEEEELTKGDPSYVEQQLDRLTEQYPEEKEVPVAIEGTEEQVPMSRVVPGNFAYVFYADDDRYEISFDPQFDSNVTDESTVFVKARDQVGGSHPEVIMQIDTVPGKETTDLISEKTADLEEKYPGATIVSEPVSEPVAGYKLHAREGDLPSSEVTTIYILDEQHDGSAIVVTQTVFLEAQEGHGARFHAMLKTLEVLPE